MDGDTSPDRSPGGPISCWRYTESRLDRDRVRLSAKLSAAQRTQPSATVSKFGKRKPPLSNVYPCSLSKSLSEECEDLGVDRPSTRELFPDTDLFLDSNLSPSYAHIDSPTNSQDDISISPEPPDKKKKYPVARHKSEVSLFSDSNKIDERKQNGEAQIKSEVPIESITAGVALPSEVTAASPLPVLASSALSSRDDPSSPDTGMMFMHQGRVTTYGRRRPVRDEWESEPLRLPSTDGDDDFWHEPLVDDKGDQNESIISTSSDLDGHSPSPASNGTSEPASTRLSIPPIIPKPVTATSMTTRNAQTRRGALKRKEDTTAKREAEKKVDKKVRRNVPRGVTEVKEEVVDNVEEKVLRSATSKVVPAKRTVMNRTEVFPRDSKKRVADEAPWRDTAPTTVRRTSLRARVPGQPASPANAPPTPTPGSVSVEPATVTAAPTNKSVTKLDRNTRKGKPSKSIKGVAHKRK